MMKGTRGTKLLYVICITVTMVMFCSMLSSFRVVSEFTESEITSNSNWLENEKDQKGQSIPDTINYENEQKEELNEAQRAVGTKINQKEESAKQNNQEKEAIDTNGNTSNGETEEKLVGTEVYLDLVIDLSGQTMNHILKIAKGVVIRKIASELSPPIHLNFRFGTQGIHKNIFARLELRRCFENLGDEKLKVPLDEFNIKAGTNYNWGMFQNQTVIIEDMLKGEDENTTALGDKAGSLFSLTNVDDSEAIKERLKLIREIINRMDAAGILIQSNHSSNPLLSTPHIQVTDMFDIHSPSMVDLFYNDLEDYFAFNESACCREVPKEDETVVHIRGFRNELPRIRKFWDGSPVEMSTRVLGHLGEGDKVAIIPGKKGQVNATEYEEEMRKRGMKTRVSKNPPLAGMVDFCQLKKAKKEIVGNVRSTYYMWASVFGDAKKVLNYALYRHTIWAEFSTFHFTNPHLKSRNFTELLLNDREWNK